MMEVVGVAVGHLPFLPLFCWDPDGSSWCGGWEKLMVELTSSQAEVDRVLQCLKERV